MANATPLGQTGLQGWRREAGRRDLPAGREARTLTKIRYEPPSGCFFVLAVLYVVKTIAAAARQARHG